MLHLVAVVRTYFSEEDITSIIRATRAGELGTRLTVTRNRNTLRKKHYVLAVTMKKVVFWDTKTQFLPQRRNITSSLQRPARKCCVRFEVVTGVTVKNDVFWDVTSCGSCKNRRFGGTYRLHHR
jgi:hypothetical protein